MILKGRSDYLSFIIPNRRLTNDLSTAEAMTAKIVREVVSTGCAALEPEIAAQVPNLAVEVSHKRIALTDTSVRKKLMEFSEYEVKLECMLHKTLFDMLADETVTQAF